VCTFRGDPKEGKDWKELQGSEELKRTRDKGDRGGRGWDLRKNAQKKGKYVGSSRAEKRGTTRTINSLGRKRLHERGQEGSQKKKGRGIRSFCQM